MDQENFGRKYKSILSKIKCKYCRSDISKCKHKCPEIKDTNIKPQHKRWIWNLIKKETCFAVIIDNKRVNTSIMNDKDSRGRYRDYTQRIIIKKVIDKLIKDQKIDPMYVLSHKHISIQASDFIAGETRRIILSDLDKLTMLKKLEYLDVKLFLP